MLDILFNMMVLNGLFIPAQQIIQFTQYIGSLTDRDISYIHRREDNRSLDEKGL